MVPDSAKFAYHIRNGYGWAWSMKSLSQNHAEGNFHIGPKGLSFSRASDSLNILNIITMDNDKVLLRGDFSDLPNGFHFGFKFSDLTQRTTHSIDRYDSIMLYFQDKDRMVAEQLNPITLETSRSMVAYVDVYEHVYHNIVVGDPEKPNITIRVQNFCHDCALLPSAKAQSVTFYCGEAGMAMVGLGDNGEAIKTKFFAAEGFQGDTETIDRTIANPIMDVTVPLKKFKHLVNFRNTCNSKNMVNIYYERDQPLFINCPYLGVGTEKFYARDKISQRLSLP